MKKSLMVAVVVLASITWMSPMARATFPGENGRIAFVQGGEIWTSRADVVSAQRITQGAGSASNPDWSADGKWIVFEAKRDGDKDIFVTRADGSGLRKLTHNSASDTDPSFSPDGSEIVFMTRSSGDDLEIGVIDRAGDNLRVITDNDYRDAYPSWSPDGNRIVHMGCANFILGACMEIMLYTIAPDGTDQREVTEGFAPDWAPDGERIVFMQHRDIFVIDADGSGRTLVARDRGWYPHWSPNGRRVIVHDFPVTEEDNEPELYTMRLDGTGRKRLTDDSKRQTLPVWQPLP